MLASLADAPLVDPNLVYEPKYDGIRVIALIERLRPHRAEAMERRGEVSVTLLSRVGNDKTAQFPEIVQALEHWSRRVDLPVVLDGELVALDGKGNPVGFQHLQGRIHLTEGGTDSVPVAFIAFDVLREGGKDLRGLTLVERRARLEKLIPQRPRSGAPLLRISEIAHGDGRALKARANAEGWEGLIAKRSRSVYHSGRRTPEWRKLKITREQEFVIGGWTEPRGTRSHFGALLLGVYEEPSKPTSRRRGGTDRQPTLIYAGHTGTGFDERELNRLYKLLRPLETAACPFDRYPPANEKPHWVKPELVAQVRFAEWTADGLLRQPVYLGLRDDKKPRDVRREEPPRLPARVSAGSGPSRKDGGNDGTNDLVEQLRALEDSRKDGALQLPDGSALGVTNLSKIFWPARKLTKGDLFRYYAQVAPLLLPVVADRALVMKRFPNGVAAKPFYQHRVLDTPPGVRVEPVEHDDGVRQQIVGGTLLTLMYTTQLAAISQDPWFSRVRTPHAADQVALDLDPMPTVSFPRVLEVARWLRDELDAIGAVGFPKTSGADGLHIYVPLPPDTPYEAGLLFVQIVATIVAARHPAKATMERTVAARGDRVYIDCFQNIEGKTLASAYSARASEWAGVSTPLSWKEVDDGVSREDFTITTVPERIARVGDLWAGLRQSKGVDLARAARRAERVIGGKRRR